MKSIAAIRLAACAALASFSVPAWADWQYSRWGMSPLDLATAAPLNSVRAHDNPRLSTPNSTVRAVAAYEASGVQFTAIFGFDGHDQLNKVMLVPLESSRCNEVRQLLRTIYGEPLRDGSSRNAVYDLAQWRDEDGRNLVRFLNIGNRDCTVEYEPLPSRTDSGL